MNVTIVTGPAIRRVRSACTIRIVCVSDTHFYHQHLDLPDGDILVHAGDFMAFGDLERHIAEFNEWLGEQPHLHKIVIAGNHDSMFESSPAVARALLTNAIYLESSGVELKGLRFWGSPVQQPSLTQMLHRPPEASTHTLHQRLPNSLHKESRMKMQATLGHPILIAIYSTALLSIGCGVGVHWTHALPTALWLCIAGGILMAAHDLATGFVWFWLTARWVRSMTQRDNRG
jgi:hypothetical protein